MLFDATIKKELIRIFSAVVIVLLSIVLVMLFIVALNMANSGTINPTDILPEAGYRILGQLGNILSLGLFISVTSLFGRMYKESEMIIWLVSGKSLFSTLKPIFTSATPIIIIIIINALYIWPISNQQIQNFRLSFQQQSDLSRVDAGVFQFSKDGTKVFFIDKDRIDDKTANNIFLVNYGANKTSVLSAKSAKIWLDDDNQYLQLNNGQSVETIHNSQISNDSISKNSIKWNIYQFDQYNLLLEKKIIQPLTENQQPYKQQSTANLLRQSTVGASGELSWRLGIIFSSINCIFLAIAITYVNPRKKYNASTAISVLSFFAYYNMLNFGKQYIGSGGIGLFAWLFMLHGTVFALALLLICKRHFNWLPLTYLRSIITKKA